MPPSPAHSCVTMHDEGINRETLFPFSAKAEREIKGLPHVECLLLFLYSALPWAKGGEKDTKLNFPNIIIVLKINLILKEVFDHSLEEKGFFFYIN